MLETIREFAAERLTERREEDRLRGRQIDMLVDAADRAGLGGVAVGGTRWQLHLIAPELDNIRVALAWAVNRDAVQGLRLATALEAFWVVRDPTEGAAWLERLLAAAVDAPPDLRANSCRALGGTFEIFGSFDRAAPFY